MVHTILRKPVPALVLWGMFIFPGFASDGRVEINQAAVEAAGGFPFAVTEPGSYVLTSSLVVPEETDALVLSASDVVLDLNGFTISSDFTCSDPCASVTGSAIRVVSSQSHGMRSTVRNGIIRGFGDDCVRLATDVQVTDLVVNNCGGNGISVQSGSLVTHNRVYITGENGILVGDRSTYAYNVVRETNRSEGDHVAIQGGRASAGNVCGDRSCGDGHRKAFYLTMANVMGNQARTACAGGFHMASMWEILDTTQLRYEESLGRTNADSGSGPPNGTFGWVRTGYFSSSANIPGQGNCLGWTSDLITDSGSTVLLPSFWDLDQGLDLEPWLHGTDLCSNGHPVWCVED